MFATEKYRSAKKLKFKIKPINFTMWHTLHIFTVYFFALFRAIALLFFFTIFFIPPGWAISHICSNSALAVKLAQWSQIPSYSTTCFRLVSCHCGATKLGKTTRSVSLAGKTTKKPRLVIPPPLFLTNIYPCLLGSEWQFRLGQGGMWETLSVSPVG